MKSRFAPSPTGYLHIGGARTALFAWLWAKKNNSKFVLRIEDTDKERSTQSSVDAILEGLDWLGLDYDEGPIYQSDRTERYNEVISELLTKSKAYYCDCSIERLEIMREEQIAKKEKPKYDGCCRNKGLKKGVFSLINIFDSINFNFELNIVGLKKKITPPNDKVKLFNEVNSTKKIISFYDKCNIFVLPSYTEGAPKVIFESLSRYRPIIVFEEIKHVKENFRGIFVCRRQTKDFINKVRYIMKNYKYIINEIKKNKIHTKKQFQNELSELFNENFK